MFFLVLQNSSNKCALWVLCLLTFLSHMRRLFEDGTYSSKYGNSKKRSKFAGMSKSELVLKQTLGIMWVLLWVLGYGHVLLSLSHRFPVPSHVIPRLCGFCMELKVSTYPHPMELYQISRNPIDLSFRIMWYCLGQTHTNPKACYCTWKMCRILRNA